MEHLIGVVGILIVFGLIISIHEFGHFILGKLSGMAVQEYSLGFGPALFSRTYHGTLYALRIIPLGGYVRIAGMEVEEEDHPDGYDKKPFLAKFLTILAGSAMNFVLAMAVLVVLGMAIGFPQGGDQAIVGAVQMDSPAARAGIMAGDLITQVGGVHVTDAEGAVKLIHTSHAPIAVTIERQGTPYQFSIMPKELQTAERKGFHIDLSTYQGIGVVLSSTVTKCGPLESVKIGFLNVIDKTMWVIASLVSMTQGKIPLNKFGGPVMVAHVVYDASKSALISAEGMANFLSLIAFLSINIGFVNLLPIPALDGSRLLILVIEGIRRKPFDRQKEAIVHLVGMALLLGLILLITLNDVITWIHPPK